MHMNTCSSFRNHFFLQKTYYSSYDSANNITLIKCFTEEDRCGQTIFVQDHNTSSPNGFQLEPQKSFYHKK